MTYNSRGVRLRNVGHGDMPLLFALFNDPGRSYLWGHRRVLEETQFYEGWAQWSAERMGAKFIVEWKRQPIGLVYDYERTLEDGHTKVTAILLEQATGRGAGVIATALFVDWLFRSLPFRKLYLDVYGFNGHVLALLKKLGVRQEMHRLQHRYWNGQYWDSYGFAIYRGDYPELCDRILQSRRGRKTHADLQTSKSHWAESRASGSGYGHDQLVDEAMLSEMEWSDHPSSVAELVRGL